MELSVSSKACTMPGTVLTLLLATIFIVSLSAKDITLTIGELGSVTGYTYENTERTSGATFNAFLGIPYGKIAARFKLAEEVPPWKDTKITQKDGSPCPQPGNMVYSEDCLFLNVFTPVSTQQNLPVMAFIHGSGFTVGSSSSSLFGPDFLVPKGVILVTMNYRLGAVGFLTLGSQVMPGNLGMHDTWLALQWIQKYISFFGGDKTKVTLFGQSAGAAMTQLHYLSPRSTGLFTKAISHSGSALADWASISPSEGAHRAKLLAQAVNCNSGNDSAILDCLQKANISSIIAAQNISLSDDDKVNGNSLPFVPVIDSSSTSSSPFFNDSLANLEMKAIGNNIPLISGFTKDDGILKFSSDDWMNAESNLGAFIPKTSAGVSVATRASLATKIKAEYFPDTASENKVQDLVRLYTDTMFAYPSIKVSKKFANLTYGYVFAYYGSWAITPEYFKKYNLKGVNHGDDLRYLFFSSDYSQNTSNSAYNQANLNVRNQMVTWWTNFASDSSLSDWPKISEGVYMMIDNTSSKINNTNFENQYYDFWAGIENDSTKSSAVTVEITITLFFVLCGLITKHL